MLFYWHFFPSVWKPLPFPKVDENWNFFASISEAKGVWRHFAMFRTSLQNKIFSIVSSISVFETNLLERIFDFNLTLNQIQSGLKTELNFSQKDLFAVEVFFSVLAFLKHSFSLYVHSSSFPVISIIRILPHSSLAQLISFLIILLLRFSPPSFISSLSSINLFFRSSFLPVPTSSIPHSYPPHFVLPDLTSFFPQIHCSSFISCHGFIIPHS